MIFVRNYFSSTVLTQEILNIRSNHRFALVSFDFDWPAVVLLDLQDFLSQNGAQKIIYEKNHEKSILEFFKHPMASL